MCNNLVDDIIKLVTRLFQQGWYIQACYNNIVTVTTLFRQLVSSVLLYLNTVTVSDLLEQPCNKQLQVQGW